MFYLIVPSRKKARNNPVYDQPQFPAPSTAQAPPPAAAVVAVNADTDEVRTSLQSNGYIEFKTKVHPKLEGSPKRDTHQAPKLPPNDRLVHKYFEPHKHTFTYDTPSKTVIKHTYFNPGATGSKTLASGYGKNMAEHDGEGNQRESCHYDTPH